MTKLRLPSRLPQLAPWAAWLVRLFCFANLIGGLAMLPHTLQAERDKQRGLRAEYAAGIFVLEEAAGWVARPSSRQAAAAGIAPGTPLVAVDGHPPAKTYDDLVGQLGGPDGSSVRLTMAVPGGQRDFLMHRDSRNVADAHRGTPFDFAELRWFNYGMNVVAQLGFAVVAVLLILRRPRDAVAGLISFGMAYNTFGSVNALLAGYPAVLDELSDFSTLATMLGLLAFPDGRMSRPRWAVVAGFAISLTGVTLTYDLGGNYALWVLPYYLAEIGLAVCLIQRLRASPPGRERQQMKLIVLGQGLAILGGGINMAMTLISRGTADPWIEVWAHFIAFRARDVSEYATVLTFLVALLRYRLYDADAIISRSAAYAFLTLLLGATFAGTEKVIEVIGEESFGESFRALAAGGGAAVAVVLITPLHGRIHRWTEKRFQKALVALRHDLPRLVTDMRDYATLAPLLATIAARIERGVRAAHIAVLLREDDALVLAHSNDIAPEAVEEWRRGWQAKTGGGLDIDREDEIFPIRVALRTEGAGPIGWLLLGPRPDGSFYAKDERAALAEIADPIARAIHVVRMRDARTAEVDARFARLEALLPGIARGAA